VSVKTFGSEILTSNDVNTFLANSGLVFVKQQAIAAGGTAVTITDAFSSTYDSYRVVYENIGGNAGFSAFITLSASTGTTYYWAGRYWPYTGAIGDAQSGGATNSGFWLGIMGAGNSGAFDIINPYYSGATTRFHGQSENATYSNVFQGYDSGTGSSTAFTITLASGTLGAGTVTVYGYRKA
jgi:hypothetical protein